MQVAETRFELAKAVKEINGDWNQLSRGQGDRTTDENMPGVLLSSSHLSSLGKLALSSQASFFPRLNQRWGMGVGGEGGGLGCGFKTQLYRFVIREKDFRVLAQEF